MFDTEKAPPEPVRWPQPGELWSLWDMLDIKLRDFLEATQRIAQMRQAFMTLEDVDKPGMMNVAALGAVMGAAEYVIKFAKDADLDSTLACAERLYDNVVALKMTQKQTGRIPAWQEAIRDLEHHIASTHQALKDQLSARNALMLSAADSRLFDPKEPLFGPEVHLKFPEAADDIEEAGKCLALARNKACVCHLMLAMEVALRALAQKLGATVQDKDGKWLTWLMIANNMDPKIKALPEGKEKDDWLEVLAMLNSVGRVWRNKTMHPAKNYDAAQAKKVFNAVNGFMSDLAALV